MIRIFVVMMAMALSAPWVGAAEADWEAGRWTFGEAPAGAETWRANFAGDWMPRDPHHSTLVLRDPAAVYGDMLGLLRTGDLNVVNVETTIGSSGGPIAKGGPAFQCSPDVIPALTVVPFHVGLMANNHAADYGPDSVEETIRLLNAAGVTPTGAGMSPEAAAEPLIVTVKGTRVAILNCAEGEECLAVDGAGVNGMNPWKQAAQIAELRREDRADVIIVVFHGGRENHPAPPPYVVAALRQIAEAGPDAIIAHHPHVPQSTEVWNGVPIVYSLGNFVFWYGNSYYGRIGLIATLEFAGDKLTALQLTPYQQTPEGLLALSERQRLELMMELKQIGAEVFSETGGRTIWNAMLDERGNPGELLTKLGNDLSAKRRPAWVRNHLFTQAHRQAIIDGLDRVAADELGSSPKWARELVRRWESRPVSELEPPDHTAAGK